MKKKIYTLFFFLVLAVELVMAQNWKPVPQSIASPWSEKVDPRAPLPEYPRPQLVRKNWQNLNGLWNYAIVPATDQAIPENLQGNILVPYPVESSLSGVAKRVGKDKVLWYQKQIQLDPAIRKSDRVLLHFGAVDWQCTLYVNGQEAGSHEGGYDPFSFDITPLLRKGTVQNLQLRVWDPSDEGPQPRGKQVVNPSGIWYTPVTGIWQTVWLEGLPQAYMESTRYTPDIDLKQVRIETNLVGAASGDRVQITVLDNGKPVAEMEVTAGSPAVIGLNAVRLWTPADPFLYQLELRLIRKNKVIDQVSSYFAMRKISVGIDPQGVRRMLLNNSFLFQYGMLDQGWWPDGLYTAPTDAALKFDLEKTREMGFNMVRKHVKVEPARWYYHCDQLGLLVWQDMPSGDMQHLQWDMRPGLISGKKLELDRSPASEAIYRKEWTAIVKALYNHPSIVVWVPFNEAWGQFKTAEIVAMTQAADNTRLINSASGGNFFAAGQIMDIHNYPDPLMPRAELFGKRQVLTLGEFGGLGLPLEGHTWRSKDNWGYQSFKNADQLEARYRQLIKQLEKLIPLGLSAAIYTQTTDVEVETNGMMTYDRKQVKMPEQRLNEIHQPLYRFSIPVTPVPGGQ